MIIGQKVKLSSKSRHARNRIAQHGEIWNVISETPEEILLRSERKTWRDVNGLFSEDKRWIFKKNDPDFSFVVLT